MKNLTTEKAVEYLKSLGVTFTKQTLSVWRCLGKGPRFKKIGSRVFYEQSALDEFAQGRIVETRDSLASKVNPRLEMRIR